MTTKFDDVLEKACSTELGRTKATIIASRLAKLAPAFHDKTTRAAVEAHVKHRIQVGSDLEKGMATTWLANARNAVVGAGKAAAGAYNKVAGKAGDLGAAAGEKLARSPVGAKSMAAASEKGGVEAADRMRVSLQPRPAPVNSQAGRPSAPRGPHMGEPSDIIQHTPAQRTSLSEAALATKTDHQRHIQSAHAAGAKLAGEAHVGAAARQGRVIARHAFNAGIAIAAGGAGLAGLHGSLSEAQHKQRVEAGKHSHDKSGA